MNAHRVLTRQIRRASTADGALDLAQLLRLVNDTYWEHDKDLVRSDRGNRLMAEELEELAEIRERASAADAARIAAEAASQAKGQFLANISHELRTPLNAIIGYAELVSESLGPTVDAEVSEDVGRIRTAAFHLLKLINEVLDFSKIEAGGMNVVREEVDVKTLAEETIATARPLALRGNVELSLHFLNDPGSAVTDAMRVKQCLLNLLSNAVKFSEGGLVSLTVSRERSDFSEMLVFGVADNGIGMPEDALARVFNAFEQADASMTRRFGGTGLGLSITRSLARALGGDVSAVSTLGVGSTFTLRVCASAMSGGAGDVALDAVA